jgi:2-furoyl-CoA dehydrogenase large subunit
MSGTGESEVEIRGTPAQVWAFLWDADALGRVLPGCESIRALAPGRYGAVIAFRTSFLTVRSDVTAEVRDPVEPLSCALTLDGSPRGLGGAFHVRVPLSLAAAGTPEEPRTRIGYAVEVEVTGMLASLGPEMMRDALVGEVRGLAADIDREIAAGRVPAGRDG